MIKMKKYILFDLDGTLTDPAEGIIKSIKYSLEKLEFNDYDESILTQFIGAPLAKAYGKYFGFDEEKSKLAVSLYREYFNVTGIFENYVYDGIPELLEKLHADGYTLAVATLKPTGAAKRILEHFDLAKFFTLVEGSDPNKTNEGKADIIANAISALNIEDKSVAVMTGDREHDMLGSSQNGIDSIGVLYGYGSREEVTNAGAKMIAETAADVYDLIKNN